MFVFIATAWTVGYQLIYAGKIFPGVTVAGVDVSGLSPTEATLKLSQTLSFPLTGRIVFRDGEKIWVAAPVELGMAFDPSASAVAAYQWGRAGGPFAALNSQVRARSGLDISPVIVFDQRVAYTYLQNLALQINQQVAEATLKIDGANVIALPGQVGRSLSLDATMIYLGAQLQSFRDGEVQLVIQEVSPRIFDVSTQTLQAQQILSQAMQLAVPNYRAGDPGPWMYDQQSVASMLVVQNVEVDGIAAVQLKLDENALRLLLLNLQSQIDRTSVDARFIFNDSTRQLEPISASAVGRTLDVEASIRAVNDALLRGEHNIPLTVIEKQPAIPDNASGEQFGITELVGQTTTFFYGSSEARIQNVQTASARFHGVMVAPGATFSMGEVMGDVSLDNGFAEALIIYGNRTIKGVGGGVCQVSTTLFRTVFQAGFPVAERHSHAYRVSYYEMTSSGAVDPRLAGMDATVYFPLVDFKFTNDTPYWLLMETYMDVSARSLTWKLYSTSDGRTVSWDTTGPINVVGPPSPRFEENPEFKKTEIKEVEHSANGADIVVTRTVYRNGQVYFTDNFQTHYQPWQAICQYGSGMDDPQTIAKKRGLCIDPSS